MTATGTPLIDIVAGARPNCIKIAPIIRALQLRQGAGRGVPFRLVHTGQHYDARMSGDFFSQVGIPEPDVNLEVGSGMHAEQTAAIMVRYERLLLEQRSELCLVETVTIGTNELIGTDPSRLKPALDRLFAGEWKKGGIPENWDGKTGAPIVGELEALVGQSNG